MESLQPEHLSSVCVTYTCFTFQQCTTPRYIVHGVSSTWTSVECMCNLPAVTVRTMYVHCTYSWYNVRTMYVHCTYSARWAIPVLPFSNVQLHVISYMESLQPEHLSSVCVTYTCFTFQQCTTPRYIVHGVSSIWTSVEYVARSNVPTVHGTIWWHPLQVHDGCSCLWASWLYL